MPRKMVIFYDLNDLCMQENEYDMCHNWFVSSSSWLLYKKY